MSFPDYKHLLQENYVEYKYFDMDMSNGREVLTVRSDDLTPQIVRS
jgi:hypothetical protein